MVTVNNIALGFAILFAVIVLVVGFGIWSMVQSDREMMDGGMTAAGVFPAMRRLKSRWEF